MIVCYECHTTRTEIVLVAEDQQQQGLYAVQDGDHDKAIEHYKQAREVLLSESALACKQHVPPMFCAAVHERAGWGDRKVWLQNIFGTYVVRCAVCKELRPCIDCDQLLPRSHKP